MVPQRAITGNLERLGEALVDRGFQSRGTQMALIGCILAAYLVGATAGATASRAWAGPLLLPAGLLLGGGVAGLRRRTA